MVLPKPNRLVIVDGKWHKVLPTLNKDIFRMCIQTFCSLELKSPPMTQKKLEKVKKQMQSKVDKFRSGNPLTDKLK